LYEIYVRETLSRRVFVQASSYEDALEFAHSAYNDGNDDFQPDYSDLDDDVDIYISGSHPDDQKDFLTRFGSPFYSAE